MDTYSISSGTAVGNELSREARDQNQFRVSQNAVLVGNIANTLANDKKTKTSDEEFKVGMDSYGTAGAIGDTLSIQARGGFSGLASETADNFRSAGNKIANLGTKAEPKATVGGAEGGDEFLEESRRAMTGEDTAPVVRPSELAGQSVEDVVRGGGEAGADAATEGLAKGLTAATGEGSRFGGLSEAGGVGRFLANRAGITSELGVEVGGKALGALGGAISGGQDITNLIDTGHIFKKNESTWSEAGNIMSMTGAALDMASIAVPVLAPLALATNVASAVAGTIGSVQDDKNQIATDSKPPPDQPLSTHPAWSAVGMTASVHQPSVV